MKKPDANGVRFRERRMARAGLASIAFAAARVGDVDPFEDHRELGGGQLDAALGRRRRDAKGSAFESLVPNRVAIGVPVKKFQ